MNNLDALIAKLEEATEGSRELDTQIHCALHERIVHSSLPKGYTMEDLENTHRNRGLAESRFIHSGRGPSPHYTTSLDAAMTLVPEGCRWDIQQDRTAAFASIDGETTGRCSTPALALCIAALKAQAAADIGKKPA